MEEFKPIVGTCLEMCPDEEVEMRRMEGLLHRLENLPHYQPVKEYTRSAAGTEEEPPCFIRPPEVLRATLIYMFNNVITRNSELEVYNFVNNRLRSIKQDLFKQQCSAEVALPILEPIARYYAWAAFRYCENRGFEPHLNDLLFLDCIKECLRLADQDNFPASDDIEALYILYTLGQSEGIMRAMRVLASRRSPAIEKCRTLSVLWLHGNFTGLCKRIKKLLPLLAAYVSVKHLENIRKYGLAVMTKAYGCTNLLTPWQAIERSLLFTNEDDAIDACEFYSVYIQDKGVIFSRSLALGDSVRPFKKPGWIQEKLDSICLHNLLLEGLHVLR